MAQPIMSEPVLIWGAGAIGGTIGAYLARAGNDVLLVDKVAAHVEACRTSGLSIEGPIDEFTTIVPAVCPQDVSGTFSRVILAVKAQHTGEALDALLPHLAADGYILSAQNGLNELLIAQRAGAERTLGCFVNFGADWHGPGKILYGNRGAMVIGEIDGSIRQRTRDLFELLKLMEPDAVLTDDIWGYKWGKLTYGAMLFATALTNESMSANFADPARLPVWIALGREVFAVAAARNVKPRGFGDFDPAAFAPDASDGQARAMIDWLADYTSKTAKTHSGIWRDLAVRKRKTEVDAQIAIIATLAQEHGIATPALDTLVTLIHDIEEGRRSQSLETLKILVDTCNSHLKAGSRS